MFYVTSGDFGICTTQIVQLFFYTVYTIFLEMFRAHFNIMLLKIFLHHYENHSKPNFHYSYGKNSYLVPAYSNCPKPFQHNQITLDLVPPSSNYPTFSPQHIHLEQLSINHVIWKNNSLWIKTIKKEKTTEKTDIGWLCIIICSHSYDICSCGWCCVCSYGRPWVYYF